MAFRVPTFNLSVNLYRGVPVMGTPTLTCAANLSPGRRTLLTAPIMGTVPTFVNAADWGDVMELLLPKLTDIRGFQNAGLSDVVECPATTFRYYAVLWVDDVGKGFPNEYRLALIKQISFQMLTGGAAQFAPFYPGLAAWPVPTL